MPTDSPRKHVKRASVRFAPDIGAFAMIDVEPHRADGSFQPAIIGLVAEESTKGTGLVVMATDLLKVGTYCRVQVGKLSPLRAEVRWRQEVAADILRVGLLYLE